MPDYVPIQDLTIVRSIGDNDLFPLSDGSGAYAVRGSTIKSYAASDAASAAADAELAKTAAQGAATNAGLAQSAAEAAAGDAADAVAQISGVGEDIGSIHGYLVDADDAASTNLKDWANVSAPYGWEAGYYNASTGDKVSSDVYIRSATHAPRKFQNWDIITIAATDPCVAVTIYEWGADGAYIGRTRIPASGDKSSPWAFRAIVPGHQYGFSVKTGDSSVYNNEAWIDAHIQIHLARSTDGEIMRQVANQMTDLLTMENFSDPVVWTDWAQQGGIYPYAWRSGYWTDNNVRVDNTSGNPCYLCYWTSFNGATISDLLISLDFAPISKSYDLEIKEFDYSQNPVVLTDVVYVYNKTTEAIHLKDTCRYRLNLRLNTTSTASVPSVTEELVNCISLRMHFRSVPKVLRSNVKFTHFDVTTDLNWPHPDDTGSGNTEMSRPTTIKCVLTLPTAYRANGDKVPVIMFCHGASCQVTDTTWYKADTTAADSDADGNFMLLINAFRDAGYAVFDVNNTRDMEDGFSDWGSLPLMTAYIHAWEYIKQHYNVEDRLYLFSDSMGTATNLNMCKWYGGDIVTSFQTAPRPMGCALRSTDVTSYNAIVRYFVAWGLADDAALEAVDFSSSTSYAVGDYCIANDVLQRCVSPVSAGGSFDQDDWYAYSTDLLSSDQFKGFGQWEDLVEIGGVKYGPTSLPPMKVMVGTGDTGFLSEVREYYQALKNSGNYVNYREVAGASHANMSFLGLGSLRDECLAWFNRFRTISEVVE